MISDIRAFKVRVFCKWLWIFNWTKWILVVYIPTQILLTILLSIDHSSRCKLKVYINLQQIDTFHEIGIGKAVKVKRVSKILECLLLIFIYSNLKFKVTCKKGRLWMPIHQASGLTTKRTRLKSLTLQSRSAFLLDKTLKLNDHSEYFGIYCSWWNHQMSFKMVHLI